MYTASIQENMQVWKILVFSHEAAKDEAVDLPVNGCIIGNWSPQPGRATRNMDSKSSSIPSSAGLGGLCSRLYLYYPILLFLDQQNELIIYAFEVACYSRITPSTSPVDRSFTVYCRYNCKVMAYYITQITWIPKIHKH